MTVIAVANQKGGVGKTTTVVNLGACLAKRGKKTLVVDLDPQANATASLGMEADDRPSVYEALVQGTSLVEVMVETQESNLWLAPSEADLAGAEVELVALMAREYRLSRALDGMSDDFDFVLVDCPPSLGLLTINGMAAADEMIVPVQCEYLALEGLGQLTQTLDLVRNNLNPKLKLRGLLLTMFDGRTNLAQQVENEVRSHFPNTFRSVIPRSVRVSEAPSHGIPAVRYDPQGRASLAYDALAREMVEGMGRKPAGKGTKR